MIHVACQCNRLREMLLNSTPGLFSYYYFDGLFFFFVKFKTKLDKRWIKYLTMGGITTSGHLIVFACEGRVIRNWKPYAHIHKFIPHQHSCMQVHRTVTTEDTTRLTLPSLKSHSWGFTIQEWRDSHRIWQPGWASTWVQSYLCLSFSS